MRPPGANLLDGFRMPRPAPTVPRFDPPPRASAKARPITAPVAAGQRSWRRRALFYVLFAVTITASVQLIGVFLVFASLILPALAATGTTRPWRLPMAYAIGLAGYAIGLIASALWDVPTGAAVVVALTIVVAFSGLFRAAFGAGRAPARPI